MKRCTTCRLEKQEVDFALKRTKRQPVCKQCKRNYNKTWYAVNKETHVSAVQKNNAKYMAEIQEFVNELKNKPCTDCGNRFPPYAMDFDHLDPSMKDDCVSRMIRHRRPLTKISAEISKCELVCAVCHRIRTHDRNAGSNPAGETKSQ